MLYEVITLEVSSPGLTEGFKVRQQYIKYEGREIKVEKQDGEKLEGLLKISDEEGIILETSERKKLDRITSYNVCYTKLLRRKLSLQ